MKSLKNSSNGEPGGTIGTPSVGAATRAEVVILTTEGLICSARSAKLSGAPRACDCRAGVRARARPNPRAGKRPAPRGRARARVTGR